MKRIHELLDRWVAETPEQIATIDHDGRKLSYASLAEAVEEASCHLRAADVRPGDRVTVVAENATAFIAFVFAASRHNAWVVPVNARLTASEITRLRDHARPRAMVFTHRSSAPALAHARHFGAKEVSGGFGEVKIVGRLPGEPEPVAADAAEQVAVLMYTTGTTGVPKGVMLTHGNLLYMSGASQLIRAMTAADRILAVLPLTHIFAFASAFLAAVRSGAQIQLLPRFEPAAVFRAMEHGASVMPAVPQMYALLLRHARDHAIERPNAPRLRYLSSGGAPLDPDWKRRVEAFFGVTLHNGYGLTEAAPGIAATRVGMERGDIACGPPMPDQEVRIVPAPGQIEMQGGVGEIIVRGPNVMKGYYRNPEATAEVLTSDGWLHTGDLGMFTDDGALMVVGRCKELIIRSGFNVYPPEVEAVLTEHPGVVLAAVVGRREPGGNEEVLAFVQTPSPGLLTEAELNDHVRARLAPYKRPARIVVTDKLPVSSAGKILKSQLVATFAAALESTPVG